MDPKKTTIKKLATSAARFRRIHEKVHDAIVAINPVEIVTPENANEEKATWIKKAKNGIFDNPVFTYNQKHLDNIIALRPQLERLRSELETTSCPPDPRDPHGHVANQFILEHFRTAIEDAIDTTFLAEAIKNGKDDVSKSIIEKKYGYPSKDSFEKALAIVKNNYENNCFEHTVEQSKIRQRANLDSLINTEFDAKEIKRMFKWAMDSYPNTEAWPIVISDDYTSIDVRDKSAFGYPIIAIPKSRKVNGMKLAELIGHEIECHWRSSVNANLIGALKCDDELIYEGLAVLKDKNFNLKYLGTINFNSAYYIFSMQKALIGKSFGEVGKAIFDCLPECVSDAKAQKAWMYTYRIFRGITDTKNPHGYAFTKDRAYYDGWHYVKELQENGKADYLNFSTLSQKTFERLMQIVDVDNIRNNVIVDKNIQDNALGLIRKDLPYYNKPS